VKRVIQNVGLFLYLLLTAAAFLYTMVRVRMPLIPWRALVYSYVMMAPYQGYEEVNADLYAEGLLPTGVWELIDLDTLYPFVRGEANFRRELGRNTYPTSDAEQATRDRAFAMRLLAVRHAAGRPYVAVRLSHDVWPVSLESFAALRTDLFLQRSPMLQIP
jgi:hypothetical protein